MTIRQAFGPALLAMALVLGRAEAQTPAPVPAPAPPSAGCGMEPTAAPKPRKDMSSAEIECVYQLYGLGRAPIDTSLRMLRKAAKIDARLSGGLKSIQCAAARRELDLLAFETGEKAVLLPPKARLAQLRTASIALTRSPPDPAAWNHGAAVWQFTAELHEAFRPVAVMPCRY